MSLSSDGRDGKARLGKAVRAIIELSQQSRHDSVMIRNEVFHFWYARPVSLPMEDSGKPCHSTEVNFNIAETEMLRFVEYSILLR